MKSEISKILRNGELICQQRLDGLQGETWRDWASRRARGAQTDQFIHVLKDCLMDTHDLQLQSVFP
jgi:hypothetical protein